MYMRAGMQLGLSYDRMMLPQEILRTDESHFSVIPVESYNEINEACVGIRDTQVGGKQVGGE